MVTTGAIATVLPYMRAVFFTAARDSVISWCPLPYPHHAAGLLAGGPSGASRAPRSFLMGLVTFAGCVRRQGLVVAGFMRHTGTRIPAASRT